MENKETLEEVCDKVLNYLIPDCKKEMSVIQYSNAMDALKSIADWQAKRMYSEEEVRDIIDDFNSATQDEKYSINKWFEQFKKK